MSDAKRPSITVTAEMIRASMVKDDSWLTARQAETDAEVQRLGELVSKAMRLGRRGR